MRTQGSLRVVLNTSVWSGMKVEHPSAKSVRLTGQSAEGVIGVFLVQCTSPKDADQLFHALEWRVEALKRVQQKEHQQKGDRDEDESADADHDAEVEEPSIVNTNTNSTLASCSPASDHEATSDCATNNADSRNTEKGDDNLKTRNEDTVKKE